MIKVRNLTKEYKYPVRRDDTLLSSIRNLFSTDFTVKQAVNNISFEISQGEMVGYIGPNGAGKSSSIKMLTGILVPTSGEVEVNGIIPYKERKKNAKQIGVVFGQKTQLWWDVPLKQSLLMLRDIYNIPQSIYKTNVDMFHDLLDLGEFINIPVRQLSLGQRMRADLAASLIHNPSLIFLDEPTIGVDIVAKERLRTFIREINRDKKTTVLITTHDMKDIEKLCSRMMIIDHGSIIYDGNINEIRSKYGKYRTLIVEFESEIPDFEVPQATLVKSDGCNKSFKFNRFETSPSQLISFISRSYPIIDLTVEEPEIEDLVRKIYEGKAR